MGVSQSGSLVPDSRKSKTANDSVFALDQQSTINYTNESGSEYLDRRFTVLNDALLKLIKTSISGVNQAMVVATNIVVLKRACDFFFVMLQSFLKSLLRMVERGRWKFPLAKACDAAKDRVMFITYAFTRINLDPRRRRNRFSRQGSKFVSLQAFGKAVDRVCR